jgi:hypothetical protein
MQAITTKFLGASNYRGSRVKASCDGGTITLGWDDALNSEDNHVAAARALITKLGWFHDATRGDRYGDWFSGWTPNGWVFVCTVDYAKVQEVGR